jgi:DNA-binding transcriptional ArsR family regulator
LLALESFYGEFFAEEEERIRPHVQSAGEQGQAWAAEMPLEALFEELSQGVRYNAQPDTVEIVFAPVFWSTPLIIELPLGGGKRLFTYGARPGHVSLVPGEAMPEDLPQALKALADPTRLRIVRLLGERPFAPGELAQELRLRPSTVTHHLQTLRLARLVRLTLGENDRRVYALRPAGIERIVEMLYTFIQAD